MDKRQVNTAKLHDVKMSIMKPDKMELEKRLRDNDDDKIEAD